MATPKTSDRIFDRPPEFRSMDFQFLKNEALEYIREHAEETWTDHNFHDPGITILEQLCYAISELGHRTDMDIRDVITAQGQLNQEDHAMFTPARILSANPLTYIDFRKIIIDCPRIQNAWLEKRFKLPAPDIYYERETDTLNYSGGERLHIKGTYDVQLEFEVNEGEENLNSNIIRWPHEIAVAGADPIRIWLEFPFWDELSQLWARPFVLDTGTLALEDRVDYSTYEGDDDIDRYDLRYKIRIRPNELLTVKVNAKPGFSHDPTKRMEQITAIENALLDADDTGILNHFRLKSLRSFQLAQHVKERLQQHRNLCEEFVQFKSIRVQDIGVNAEIELTDGAQFEVVLDKIHMQLRNFFNPDISFFTLEELLDRGIDTDIIFNGPRIYNGVLLNEEMEKLNRIEVLYTSDLLNCIMDVEEVKTVSNLSVSNFLFNEALNTGETSCLILAAADRYQPKFSAANSSFTLIKSSERFESAEYEQGEAFAALAIPEVSFATKAMEDLFIPYGNISELSRYHSIQNDLPDVYGIGEQGLPKNATKERRAQAHQLKAYLLVFEQFLADYLAQLSHMSSLFSTHATLPTTSFSQPVGASAQSDFLYTSNYNSEFIQREDQRYHPRRNQFLDHLAAKLGFDFSEYSNKMSTEEHQNTLIANKIHLLRDYPQVSELRGVGMQLRQGKLFSGIENRLNAMLGLTGTNSTYVQVIEHLLLRPTARLEEEEVQNVSAVLSPVYKNSSTAERADPYSFLTTVLLPNWDNRFRAANGELTELGDYAEQLVASELPAHIDYQIVWVHAQESQEFRTLFESYLTLLWHNEPWNIVDYHDQLIDRLDGTIEKLEALLAD